MKPEWVAFITGGALGVFAGVVLAAIAQVCISRTLRAIDEQWAKAERSQKEMQSGVARLADYQIRRVP